MTAAELEPGELREQRLREAERGKGCAEPLSVAQCLALLPAPQRASIIEALPPSRCGDLLHDWRFWGRPTQFAPADPFWSIWLVLAGRGWGKTRTGVEWIRERVESGQGRSIGIIGPTLGDVWKDVVYGTDGAPGLVKIFPRHLEPDVRRNDREIHFYNGAVARIFTAEEPELRGPNLDTVLCDELAKWRYLQALWDNLEFALRARGRTPPRVCITTTPRPLALLKDLLDDPDVRFTFGSTFANAANLSSNFIRRMVRKFKGSRLGLQELYGALLGDNPDALFQASWIDPYRWSSPHPPELRRIVVAIDPAVSSNRRSDITGIVVVGIGFDGDLYVLADLSGVDFSREGKGLAFSALKEPVKHSPSAWGELSVRAYHFFKADSIVCETNRGGDLVKEVVQTANRAFKGAKALLRVEEVHATRGKVVRADPVAALYEIGRVHHVGAWPQLETEMTEWNPKLTYVSPNRLDALVWGAHAVIEFGELPADPGEGAAGLAAANARMRLEGADDYDRLY